MLESMLDDLDKMARKMECDNKVDLSVLSLLYDIKSSLSDRAERWGEKPHDDAFLFYYGLKNSELYIEEMIGRFKSSSEKHDNPKIALDTILLIPSIREIVSMSSRQNITKQAANDVLDAAMRLRDKAIEANLLPPPDSWKRYVTPQELSEGMSHIAKNFHKEYGE